MLPLPYLDSRTLAGWLSACLAVGLIAGAAAFWSRSAAAAPVQDAQLRIADVRNVSSGPICAGSQASFDVDVANTGTAPATVALAMVGTNRNVLVRISGVFTVAPGASSTQRVEIESQPQLIRAGALRPTILVVNASAPPGAGWLDQLFKDGNNNDHVRLVSQPVAGSRNVSVQLTDVRVLDDCDNVSAGDWMMHFGVEATGNRGAPVRQCMRRPRSGSSVDVQTGSRFNVGTVQLQNVSPCSDLTIVVAAVDCDSDTLIGSEPLETWGLKNSCLTGRCGGEELPELSGNHDWVGSIRLVVPAATWTAGAFEVRAGITAIPNLAGVPLRVTHPNGVQETVTRSDCALLAPYNGLFTITPGG